MAKLEAFYRRVRPPGPGWRYVRNRIQDPPSGEPLRVLLGMWGSAVVGMVSCLLTVVTWVQGRPFWPFVWMVLTVMGFLGMNHLLKRVYPNRGI